MMFKNKLETYREGFIKLPELSLRDKYHQMYLDGLKIKQAKDKENQIKMDLKQNKKNKKAEKDLPSFLKATLKQIEKAAKRGKSEVMYWGDGTWFTSWNESSRDLLAEKLNDLGFSAWISGEDAVFVGWNKGIS